MGLPCRRKRPLDTHVQLLGSDREPDTPAALQRLRLGKLGQPEQFAVEPPGLPFAAGRGGHLDMIQTFDQHVLNVSEDRAGLDRDPLGRWICWDARAMTEHRDRVALITGVSRRAGIGFAIAQALLNDGYRVMVHGWPEHDAEQPWRADPGGMPALVDELDAEPDRIGHLTADFAGPAAPGAAVGQTVERFGAIDVLIANHARSSASRLEEVTPEELDLAWAVNARATVLLVKAFAELHDPERPDGRVLLFTSGQYLSPMPGELAYAISKGAVHQMTLSLAGGLAERGITVNTIHPGPVDTGWADEQVTAAVAERFPARRWGTPRDIAPVVRFLVSADSAWITGQVINAEGGFRR